MKLFQKTFKSEKISNFYLSNIISRFENSVYLLKIFFWPAWCKISKDFQIRKSLNLFINSLYGIVDPSKTFDAFETPCKASKEPEKHEW